MNSSVQHSKSRKRNHSSSQGEAPLLGLVKKRRRSSTCVDQSMVPGAATKRQRSPGQGEALRLVLEPPSVPVKKRRLGPHPRLHVDNNNRVLGYVNGHACRVQLDSGAEITVIFRSTARRLGLISGKEKSVKLEVELWTGRQVLKVIPLESVTVDLGGGVEVVTSATVFPACLEHLYDAENVVLDAHQLRRGGMVQVFRPDGSDLFVCRPGRLRRGVRKTRHSVEPDVLMVRPAQGSSAGDRPMTVLLDTGAKGIHVSVARDELLLESRKGRPLPRRVELDLGDGFCLHADSLEVVPSNDHDFIMGVSMLCAFGAVLDHARHTLDFKVGAAWRRVALQRQQ